MKKLRIAWHTSLRTDIFSKSEYFTSVVAPFLKDSFEIEIFSDSFCTFDGFGSHHYLAAAEIHAQKPFDLFFYQVENGVHGHFMRSALGLHPGVVLFHDYYMTDLGPDPLTNSPWELVAKKLENSSIPWPARNSEFSREGPQARREVGLTRVPIFTSPRVHCDFIREHDGKVSWYLPTPVVETQAPRGVLEDFSIAFCGTPNIEDRAHKLLMALHDLKSPTSLTWLLNEGEKDKAEELLREFRIKNAKIIIGRTPEQWGSIAGEVSVCVHTLFSVFCTTEPYLLQSMQLAKPCIVTDFADAVHIPSDAVWKVRPGDTESTEIRHALDAIQRDRRLQTNETARQYVLENHSAGFIAKELQLLFEQSSELLARSEESWKMLMRSAREALMSEQQGHFTDWNSALMDAVYNELGW